MNFEKRGDYIVGVETEAEQLMGKLGWRHDIPGRFIKGPHSTTNIEKTLLENGYMYYRGELCKLVPIKQAL